jgi:septal ring-binding cell division protein DamX
MESLDERARAHAEAGKALPPGHVTLQLMVACRAGSVERLLGVPNTGDRLWFIPYNHQGRSCYKVLWGRYTTRQEAEAARAGIPREIARQLERIPVVSVDSLLK